MWTFEGKGGYGCSPRYIAEELLKRNRDGRTRYKIYWLVADPGKRFPAGITAVRDTALRRAYHMTTARIWVANTRTFYGTRKRKQTTYYQTWHGTVSLKPIGKYRGEKLSRMAYLVSRADSRLMDAALSGSKWCTETWRDGLIYDGPIIETGTPRCDVFFKDNSARRLAARRRSGLADDAKILVYAPTFRGGSQGTVRSVYQEEVTLDFKRLIAALEERFGGSWYVFLRLHPQLAATNRLMHLAEKNGRLMDVSALPDLNAILAVSDAMITDYSTAIFEAFLSGMPCFIYADDLAAYVADRGALMFEPEEIPFSVAEHNDALVENIRQFDAESYRKRCADFIRKTGILEDGGAAGRVADLIEENC